jgi:dipeptidyl aminopeptidase/acylaminoacyl peptidase
MAESQPDLAAAADAFVREAVGEGESDPVLPGPVVARPDGRVVAAVRYRVPALRAGYRSEVAVIDVASRRVVRRYDTDPPYACMSWSPDGERLAMVAAGGVVVVEPERGESISLPLEAVAVADLSWHPDGRELLVRGAPRPLRPVDGASLPPPRVLDYGTPTPGGRLYRVDVASGAVTPVPVPQAVWQAVWSSGQDIVLLSSPSGEPADWYGASIAVVRADTGRTVWTYQPSEQVGAMASDPGAGLVAFVEGPASGQGIVAGAVTLLDLIGVTITPLGVAGIDVTSVSFARDGDLIAAGMRDRVQRVFRIQPGSGRTEEMFRTTETLGWAHPAVTALGPDACVTVRQSSRRHPELTVIRERRATTLWRSESPRPRRAGAKLGSARWINWPSADGTRVSGRLLLPSGQTRPVPLVLWAHDGPTRCITDQWPSLLMGFLLDQGFGILAPNPRGSSGRGPGYAHALVGDVGGVDAGDCLSGVDDLVESGVADGSRLAVGGGSYGGFLACWLATCTDRFRAAVALSPVTDWWSYYHTSPAGEPDARLFGQTGTRLAVAMRRRSPLTYAHRLRTPTLLVAGTTTDRPSDVQPGEHPIPTGQAVALHNAVVRAGGVITTVLYPEQGPGGLALGYQPDVLSRVAGWLHGHLS